MRPLGIPTFTDKLVQEVLRMILEAVPIYQAVLDNEPERFPGFERLLRRKRREYDNQSQVFDDMPEDPVISKWLKEFSLWDAENEEYIYLNDVQCRDINRMLQKRYGMLQWEQGSGKTLAAIAMGLYRMRNQGIHSTWVVSLAISIRNNWNVVLPNYGLPYVFVERLEDLKRIKPGDFVLLTLNKLGTLQRRIKKWIKRHNQKIMLALDESDEISNPSFVRAKAALSCFRCYRMKLLTTGTSARNNISEFAPQLELLYNNSINMITWCDEVYSFDKDTGEMDSGPNCRNALQQLWNEPVLYAIYPIHVYRVQGYLFPQLHRQFGVQSAPNGNGKGENQPVYERPGHRP